MRLDVSDSLGYIPEMESIYDPVRQKDVVMTPEEQVRQELVTWLHLQKGVPLHLMETEFSLGSVKTGTKGRVDVIVHGFRQGGGVTRPWLLAECKRPGESDWARLTVQVNRYLKLFMPEYVLLEIGSDRRILQRCTTPDQLTQYRPVSDLPQFS
jgi:hypothetical protein